LDVVAVHVIASGERLIYKVRLPAVEGAYIHVNVETYAGHRNERREPASWYELNGIAYDAVKGEDGKMEYRVVFDDDVEMFWNRGIEYF
jgi:hypothetical protein